MNDCTLEEVENILIEEKENGFMLYLYTPLCGTCAIASKMLNVVQAMLKHQKFAKIDLNYAPQLAEKYEVESVPCLLIFKERELKEKIYAFHSVPYLVDIIHKKIS
ncbi:thioredoxin family protein [Niallia sp. 03133]|uniref:thioredoxin family protein n=1 Tax=Niallia sp. 03133 TaxID=3458060 RepID=UPI0040445A57